jgi:hypothetical protein
MLAIPKQFPLNKISGWSPGSDFSVVITPRNRVISGGTSGTVTSDDFILTEMTDALVANEFDVTVTYPFNLDEPSVTSLTPAVATISRNSPGSWSATLVSAGTCNFVVSAISGTRSYSFVVGTTGGGTAYTFQNWVSGSLGAALDSTIAGYISGKTASPATSSLATTTQALYSTYGPSESDLAFNTNIFTGSADLTCILPWHNGLVISPRHIWGVAHLRPAEFNGDPITLVASDGTVFETTLQASYDGLGQYGAEAYLPFNGNDTWLGLTADTIPGSITPATVLPSNWQSYLPGGGMLAFAYTCVHTNQFKTLCLSQIGGDLSNIAIGFAGTPIYGPSASAEANWWKSVIKGDSGSPSGFIHPITGKFIGVSLTGGSFLGRANILNTAMGLLGGVTGYSLTPADLSAFPTYS